MTSLYFSATTNGEAFFVQNITVQYIRGILKLTMNIQNYTYNIEFLLKYKQLFRLEKNMCKFLNGKHYFNHMNVYFKYWENLK